MGVLPVQSTQIIVDVTDVLQVAVSNVHVVTLVVENCVNVLQLVQT